MHPDTERVRLKPRICLSCSLKFSPTRNWQRFCKPECRNSFWKTGTKDTTVLLTLDEPYMRHWREFKAGIERLREAFPPDYPYRASAFLLSVWVVMPDKNDSQWQLGRADLDHFTSAIMNGLRGVAWADDSRIFEIHAQKRYVEDDELPHTKIQITALDKKKRPAEINGK